MRQTPDDGTVRATLAAELARGYRQSAYPGAYAAVGDRHGVLADAAVGTLEWSSSEPPTAATRWDLASLTKVVALTPLVIQLEAGGALALDDEVRALLPEWTAGRASAARVQDLLTHSAGLPWWRPFHRLAHSPEEVRALVLATPPELPPGSRYVYSDVGALLLGFLAERVGGAPLDELVRRLVLAPLGLDATGYRPDRASGAGIAPTEFDAATGRLLCGAVHDDNARALGGVAGHAGLFGSGADLARFAAAWLDDGRTPAGAALPAGSVGRYGRIQRPALSHRALGWETAVGAASAGRLLAPSAVGHTGFTGTSLWIDREQELFVLLLSNRVCRSRENRRLVGLRPAFMDAAVGAVRRLRGQPAGGGPGRAASPAPPVGLRP